MAMYLALKKTPSKSMFGRIMAILIKWRLVSIYCHSGIAIDDEMYHCNHILGLYNTKFTKSEWDLYDISMQDKDRVIALFNKLKGAKYDWFGIFGFILPTYLQSKNKLYCFEWCYLAMKGEYSSDKVTPEILLKIALDNRQQAVF
jgi:hypothetical protein